MFPHTITIFRHIQTMSEDTYTRYVLKGVYWYGTDRMSKSGNGTVEDKTINIEIPKNLVDTYKTEWDVKLHDKVVLGEVDDISSVNDLKVYDDVINVTSITVNNCGSKLDNIVIMGN